MSGQAELGIQLIGSLVEVIADDECRIDMKCFEKICNAFVKEVIVALKVDVKIKEIFKEAASQV